MFIIKRHEDGRYVAVSGSAHSYTKDIRKARIYRTREAAQADACGNESVLSLLDQFNG